MYKKNITCDIHDTTMNSEITNEPSASINYMYLLVGLHGAFIEG